MIELGLCVALMAATSWAVLAAGFVAGGGGALVAGVAAVVTAAILARARIHRIAAVLVSPVLAVVVIVPATIARMPSATHQALGVTASHYVRAMATGLWSPDAWTFTVGLSALLFVCGYWLGWMALHEHRGVLAVMPVYAVLAVDVLNASRATALAFPVTLAIGLSLAVIASAYLGSLTARWVRTGIAPLEGFRWRFASSVAPVAAGLTVVALVLPAISSTDVSAQLFSHGGGAGAIENGSDAASTGTTTIGFSLSVNLGGSLVNKPKQVLTYRTSTGSSSYLQVATDTEFDRGNWYAPARGATAGDAVWGGVPFASGPLPRDANTADGGIGVEEQAIDAQIVVDPGATGNQQLVPFTGEPDGVDFSGTAFGTLSAFDQTKLLTVDSVQLDPTSDGNSTLQTVALVSTATAAQLRAAGSDYPAWTDQYTQLDDDSTRGAETIRSLAVQWTSDLTDPYDQAIAIEDHLRNPAFFQYTLDPPTDPSARVWPLVFFLTSSHRGYCQYFASAMGAMLRSLGIPTRTRDGIRTRRARGCGRHTTPGRVHTTDRHDQRRAHMGRGVLSQLWVDSLRTDAAVCAGRLRALRAWRGGGGASGASAVESPSASVFPNSSDVRGATAGAHKQCPFSNRCGNRDCDTRRRLRPGDACVALVCAARFSARSMATRRGARRDHRTGATQRRDPPRIRASDE